MILFIPGSLTLGAGVIFGVLWGSIYVSIGASEPQALFWWDVTWCGMAEKRIEGNNKFKAINKAVAREGWKIVGLTRLSGFSF